MSGHAQLTYADLDKAYAFSRGSEDEEGVVTAVDHPEFYCVTKTNGVHRAALPPMVDRGTTSFRDIEDDIIARIDGDVEAEDEIEADGCDDLFQMDEDDEVDEEYEEAWREMTTPLDPVPIETAPVPAAAAARTVEVRIARPTTSSSPATRNISLKKALRAADDELAPVTISSRRAALITHGLGQLDSSGKKVCSWKDTSAAPTQFQRHNRRPCERPIKRTAS